MIDSYNAFALFIHYNSFLINYFIALLTVPIMYSAMSINEYITHRYYQHAGFNNNWLMQTIFKGLKINGGGIKFSRILTHLLAYLLTY